MGTKGEGGVIEVVDIFPQEPTSVGVDYLLPNFRHCLNPSLYSVNGPDLEQLTREASTGGSSSVLP